MLTALWIVTAALAIGSTVLCWLGRADSNDLGEYGAMMAVWALLAALAAIFLGGKL